MLYGGHCVSVWQIRSLLSLFFKCLSLNLPQMCLCFLSVVLLFLVGSPCTFHRVSLCLQTIILAFSIHLSSAFSGILLHFLQNVSAFSAECLSVFSRMSQRFQRNVLRFREKSFGIVGDECGDFLKMAGIGGVECRKVGTVDVEHANDFTIFPQGNHDFAP